MWLLVSTALALLAGLALVGSVISSGSGEYPAPDIEIVIAALATITGAIALALAVRRLRGGRGRLGLRGELSFLGWTALLISTDVFVGFASGPH